MDTCHVVAERESLTDVIRAFGSRLFHVHFEDAIAAGDRVAPGDGILPMERILHLLSERYFVAL